MEEEDEIDVLGDFSFNSCLAQNNQGIPSCSDREDTVHPQWLLDSTATNWYDIQHNHRRDAPSRKLLGNSLVNKYGHDMRTNWSKSERELLVKEMVTYGFLSKYGRNFKKISQTLKTKSEAQIQALIEAEFGVNLETPSFGLDKVEISDDIPSVVQEEIVTDDSASINSVLNMVSTGAPTIKTAKKHRIKKQKLVSVSSENELIAINPAEILCDDDLTVGSVESVVSDVDTIDARCKKILVKHEKAKFVLKKIGNHRRKVTRKSINGKSRNKRKDILKSPQKSQIMDTNLSNECSKNPKMQIVFSSGQALPLSEGEQVIKIEKKKDSEESDIDIDVDSDDDGIIITKVATTKTEDVPVARKFEPMPKRKKKINLDGEGGYTIMHTESGDLYEIASEPRKERAPRKETIHLIQCQIYNAEKPAPFAVEMHVSVLISMDVHAHTSRAEVMGLVGGGYEDGVLGVRAYRAVAAAAAGTHCDMCPLAQAAAGAALRSAGARPVGWHHSHPHFAPAPSHTDLTTQCALQAALERAHVPFVALITSQHWPRGRAASCYRCFRVEGTDPPVGYQLSVRLLRDVTATSLPTLVRDLEALMHDESRNSEYSVDMRRDVCPNAGVTYLEKCISSVIQHMRSAGYEDDDEIVARLVRELRDVLR